MNDDEVTVFSGHIGWPGVDEPARDVDQRVGARVRRNVIIILAPGRGRSRGNANYGVCGVLG